MPIPAPHKSIRAWYWSLTYQGQMALKCMTCGYSPVAQNHWFDLHVPGNNGDMYCDDKLTKKSIFAGINDTQQAVSPVYMNVGASYAFPVDMSGVNQAIAGNAKKHKCYCALPNLMAVGCKCGGV